MSEERYKQIKDSIELQSLVKAQIGVDDELLREEIELLKTYEKLKDNWNKLKDFLKEVLNRDDKYILDKMQELEQGSDNDE